MKIGLKLWSANTDAYLREAKRLYAERVFDYLELYVVPGSQKTLPLWKALQDELALPFAIHAPHSAHGVNLADAAKRESNAKTFDEVRHFADQLDAKHIIVHGGAYPHHAEVSTGTAIEELVYQLKTLNDARILLENKPFLPIGDAPIRLVGSTPDEIRRVLTAVGCGFCLDISHAIASANAHSANWRAWIDEFLSLHPAMFHLSDLQADSQTDQHLHFGDGTLPIVEILSRLPMDASLSIETAKDSDSDLEDFRRDALRLKSYLSPASTHLKLRRAEPRDIRAVFELANDPVVRANSIHTEPISWETHVTWFNNALANKDLLFFVVETETGKLIGELRLQNECTAWVVTIHICHLFRGKHIGEWMLSEIINRTKIRQFVAFVKPDNAPSNQLFTKMGYVYTGKVLRTEGSKQVMLNRLVYKL